jgi:hypothetical protein
MSSYISRNRLPLKSEQKIDHYWLPFSGLAVSLILSSISIYHHFFKEDYIQIHTLAELLTMPLILAFLSLLLLVLKIRRLNFKKIDLKLSGEDFEEVMNRLVNNEFWELERKATNSFHYRAAIDRLSGERLITLIRKKDHILYNEIKYPNGSRKNQGISLGLVNLDLKAFIHHANDVLNKREYSKSAEFNDSQWNWKMILIRLFLYPLCIFMISLGILAFSKGAYLLGIPFFIIPIFYFTIDWIALIQSSRK